MGSPAPLPLPRNAPAARVPVRGGGGEAAVEAGGGRGGRGGAGATWSGRRGVRLRRWVRDARNSGRGWCPQGSRRPASLAPSRAASTGSARSASPWPSVGGPGRRLASARARRPCLSPSAGARALAAWRSGPIYAARAHHVLMSLCPALAAAAAQTPPREMRGEGARAPPRAPPAPPNFAGAGTRPRAREDALSRPRRLTSGPPSRSSGEGCCGGALTLTTRLSPAIPRHGLAGARTAPDLGPVIQRPRGPRESNS